MNNVIFYFQEKIKMHLLFLLKFDIVLNRQQIIVTQHARFANDCINLKVMSMETADIGEWRDDHPLNMLNSEKSEYNRLFHTQGK